MRAFFADRLLQVSSALYVASVWCKDRAIALLVARARSRRPRR